MNNLPSQNANPQPKVVVSILNWNGVHLTTKCITSLLSETYTNIEIHVLDNGSTDDEAKMLQEQFSDSRITIHRSEHNRGFSGGHNYVIAELLPADYNYCLLLNQDAELQPGCIEQLVSHMEANPTVAVTGPTVLDADGTTIQSAGATISLATGKITSLHQGTLLSQFEQVEPTPVDCIIGNCFMMRRSAIEKIGMFDEMYFAYYEEADWCMRAKQHKLSCVVVPQAQVVHSKSGGFRPYYIARNMVWFVQKFAGLGTKLQFMLYYWAWFIPERIKKGSHLGQLLRGALHGWLHLRKGKSN